jgi:hypothetical protein
MNDALENHPMNTPHQYEIDLAKEFPAAYRYPPQWGIDVRHLQILLNLIMLSDCEEYVEVGCGGGVSTAAIVKAIGLGKRMNARLCDLKFTPSVLEITADLVAASRIQLCEAPSIEVLRATSPASLVYLDGDHSMDNVRRELQVLLQRGVRTIIAHDTMAGLRARLQGWAEERFSGPSYLRDELQYRPGWFVLEDKAERDCEATGRGLVLATRDLEYCELAKQTFRYWTTCKYRVDFDCRYVPAMTSLLQRGSDAMKWLAQELEGGASRKP